MNYATGEKVVVGDNVLIEHGRTKGVIHDVIETLQQTQNWGLDEDDFGIGIMIEAEPFGLLFLSIDYEHDPTVFVSRAD